MRLEHLIFALVFSLCAGTFLSLGALKPKALDRTFFIYHGLGIAVVAAVSYFLLRSSIPPQGLWVGLFIAGTTIFSMTAERTKWAWAFFTVAAVGALGVFRVEALHIEAGYAASFSNLLLSSLLLGFTLSAMLLGHWYLVQPRLSIDELKRITLLFIALVAIRVFFGTMQLVLMLAPKGELEAYRYLLSAHPGVFVLMRWAWGLLAPAILCFLIWNTVKIRSTQSATGILYVAVVCVLIGEILSQYLMYFHKMII